MRLCPGGQMTSNISLSGVLTSRMARSGDANWAKAGAKRGSGAQRMAMRQAEHLITSLGSVLVLISRP
jgi:hypothetical protein